MNVIYMNNKKRKINTDILSRLNGTYEEVHLKAKNPELMACEVCQKPIFSHQKVNVYLTCSYDCYAILKLSKQTTFLHEKPPEMELNNALKRSKYIDNIDELNTEH